jgi:hypothetical protein
MTSTQTAVGGQLAPKVVDMTAVTQQGALSPTGAGHLTRVWLELDPHDLYVTSRSVLGYADGQRFLEIIEQPGPALDVPALAIEE